MEAMVLVCVHELVLIEGYLFFETRAVYGVLCSVHHVGVRTHVGDNFLLLLVLT